MTEWHFDYAGIESSSNKHRAWGICTVLFQIQMNKYLLSQEINFFTESTHCGASLSHAVPKDAKSIDLFWIYPSSLEESARWILRCREQIRDLLHLTQNEEKQSGHPETLYPQVLVIS